MKLSNASYKQYSAKIKILIALACFVLSYIVQNFTNAYLAAVTMNLVQPGLALNPVLGILFGWPAILGCAVGSLLDNLLSGNLLYVCGLIFIVDLTSGTIPYMLWHIFAGQETHIYRLDSHRRVLRFTWITLVNSVICGVMLAFLEALLYGTTDYVIYSFIYDALDYFDMAMLIGLPLMMIMTFVLHKINSKEKKFRGLITTEKIVLFFVAAEALFVSIFMFTLWVTRSAGDSFWDVFSNSYTAVIIIENVMVVALIFVVASAVNRDAIMRALDKLALILTLGAFIVFILILYRIGIRNLTPVGAANGSVYVVSLGFAAALIFACILDKHTVTKDTALYVSIVFILAVSLGLNLAEVMITAGSVAESYIDMFIGLTEVCCLLLTIEFINVSIKIDRKKYKYVIWPVRALCAVLAILNICAFFVDNDILEGIYAPVAIAIYIVYVYIIVKEGRDFYEKFSLIIMLCLGTVVEIVFYKLNGGLYLTPCGGIFGAVICFTNIYVKRSNSLSDTQKDLNIAATIQLSMLPKEFNFEGVNNIDIFASMDPAKEVGGDFYDFYKVSDKHIAFVIADVSGKGLPGAMLMMRGITAIKNFAMAGMSVNKIMEMASNNINEHNDAMLFITCWMGMLNVETGKLRFVNAGHNPPIIRHADGTTTELITKPDMIMGFFPGVKYVKREMFLKPGDTVYLYTDGVTEAFSDFEEQYGMDRLHNALRKPAANSRELCENVTADVAKFVGAADQFDDMTMVALTYKGPLDRSSTVKIAPEKFNVEDLAANFIDLESLSDGAGNAVVAATSEAGVAAGGVHFEESSGVHLEESETTGELKIEILDTAAPIEIAPIDTASEIKIEPLGKTGFEEVAEEIKIEPLGKTGFEEIAEPIKIEPLGSTKFEEVAEEIKIEPLGKASFEEIAEPIKIEPLGKTGFEEVAEEIKIEPLGKASFEELAEPIKIEPLGSTKFEEVAEEIKIEPLGKASFEEIAEPIKIEPLGKASFEEVAEPIKIQPLGKNSKANFEEISVDPGVSFSHVVFAETDIAAPESIELLSSANNLADKYSVETFSGSEKDFSEDNETEFRANMDNVDTQQVSVYEFGDDARVLEFIASRDNLFVVTDEIDSFLMNVGCTMSAQAKIDIAFDEIYSNIVNYAYSAGAGRCRVIMSRQNDPAGIRISVVDEGKKYNPLEHADPSQSRTLEQRSRGGVGIMMVKNTMDNVLYDRIGDKNRLTIIKHF